MFGNRSGWVVLMLAAPFALYAARQVHVAATAEQLAAHLPPDTAPSRAELAATRAQADSWTADVRKSATAVVQFRVPGPDDAATDPDCNALIRAAGKRSAELADLELFLSGSERPNYTGALRDKYPAWQHLRRADGKGP